MAGAAIGPAFGLIGRHFAPNAALAQDADRAETYRLLKLFGDAFELVQSEYVDPVSDEELIMNAVNGMLTGLDPHSAYLNADEFHEMQMEDDGDFVGIGIEVEQEGGFVMVSSPMDGSPAFRAGIKAGDVIIGLNGRSVLGLSVDRIIAQMRGRPHTRITLMIQRQGVNHPLVVSIRREIIHIPVVKQRLELGNVGYVRITEFDDPTSAALKRAVGLLKRQARGKLNALVLDLRDNPGGLMDQAVAVAREFIPHGEIVSTRARDSNDGDWVAGAGTDILRGAPMVVLINSGSASASEMVAGALQDHRRAVLVGTRSFGKGSVQDTIALPDGGGILLTTARYYTPSGHSIQGHGITPDVSVANGPQDESHFDAEHEDEFQHVISNAGGTPDGEDLPRTDLPPIAKTIPRGPPSDFPKFDPAKPDTDFQLQQALVIARAMAAVQEPAATH